MEATLKRFLPLLLLAASLPITLHAQGTAPGRMSGADIIKDFTGPRTDGQDRSPAEILARERVDGYLAGVADVTHGTVWCNKHLTKTHEIDAEVIGAIRKLPPHILSRTVAAKLLVEELARQFPCDRVLK
jgi:hypothetical protein